MPAGPLKYDRKSISGGRAGTIATLRAMRDLSRQGSENPQVIETAHRIVRRVPERNDFATMEAMLSEVRQRMRYTRDPLNVELVKAPWVVLQRTELSGDPEPMDCDDASTLLSSLLGAVGIPTRFVVVKSDRSRPSEFSHVYVQALDGKRGWVGLDPIVRKWRAGEEASGAMLVGRSGYLNVGDLSCGDTPCRTSRQCRSADMTEGDEDSMYPPPETINRLNGRNGVGADDSFGKIVDVGTDYARQRLGLNKPARQPAINFATTLPAAPASGFDFGEWFNPFNGGKVNMKAVAVLAVVGIGGYMLWKNMKRGTKRKGGRR